MKILFVLFSGTIIVAMIPIFLAVGWLRPRRSVQIIERVWLNCAAWFFTRVIGITWEIHNLDLLPKNGRYIIACQHQSLWENLIFSRALPNLRFIVKRELTWIPIWGQWLLLLGHIPVDRGRGVRSYHSMLARAKKALGTGSALMIYPEGTRSLPGQPKPLRAGVIYMAKALEAPIYPVGLNSGLRMPKNGPWKRGHITAQICPPMTVSDMNHKDALTELGETITQTSAALEAQATAAVAPTMERS